MRSVAFCSAAIILAVVVVATSIVTADPSEPTAVDGQRLSDQSVSIQNDHKAIYGGSAEWAWVANHNAELYVDMKADRDKLAQQLAGHPITGPGSYVPIYCTHNGTQYDFDSRRYSARLAGDDIIEITYTCSVDESGNPMWSAEEKNIGMGTCRFWGDENIRIGESRIGFDGNLPDTYLKCIFDASSGFPPWTRMTEISQSDYYANKPRESCGVHEGKEQLAGDRWGYTEWVAWNSWNTNSDGVRVRQWHRRYYHCQAAYDSPRVTRVGELQWFPVNVDPNE